MPLEGFVWLQTLELLSINTCRFGEWRYIRDSQLWLPRTWVNLYVREFNVSLNIKMGSKVGMSFQHYINNIMWCLLAQGPESGGKYQLGLRHGAIHLLFWWLQGRNRSKGVMFTHRIIPLGKCPVVSHSLTTNLLRKVVILQNSTQTPHSWRRLSLLLCVLDLPQLHVTPLCNFWLKGCVCSQNVSPCRQDEGFFSCASLCPVPPCAWHIAWSQCVCVCELSCFSHVQLFATLWTIAHQAPVHGILQARILGWVAMPSSRGFSQLRDWTHVSCVSCLGRWVLYH